MHALTTASSNVVRRLGAWALLSDSFMAGFFNGTPQVMVSEMIGGMTCRETIFEAETAQEYMRLLPLEADIPKCQSLAGSVSSLLQDTWPGPADESYNGLTPSNLLHIISGASPGLINYPLTESQHCVALGIVAVLARTNFLIQSSANALLRACWRWKNLWDTITEDGESDPITKSGFVKHAPELWWLVATHVKVAASGDLTCEHMHMMPTDTTEGMDEFLKKYKDT